MAENQAYLFLIFTLNGVFIGLIFDIFRILRQGFRTSNFITYIEDILFWVISGLSIIYTMVCFSNGTLRFFMIIGIIIGLIAYILTISKYIRRCSVFIINLLKKFAKFIFNKIIYPLKIVHKFTLVPITKICKKMVGTQKNTFSYLKKQKNPKKSKKSMKKRGIFLEKVEK